MGKYINKLIFMFNVTVVIHLLDNKVDAYNSTWWRMCTDLFVESVVCHQVNVLYHVVVCYSHVSPTRLQLFHLQQQQLQQQQLQPPT